MSAIITPDNSIVHAGLRDDVRRYAQEYKFSFQDFGIEHRTERNALRVLGRINDSTALYLRGSPDAWMATERTIEKPNGAAVQIEFKSRLNHDNMALEAAPLANAIGRSRGLGIRVLYCYRDVVLNRDAGFWCSDPPILSRGFIGPRDQVIHPYIKRAFPEVDFLFRDDLNGSGDSFVIVNMGIWISLPSWRELLDIEFFGVAA